MLRARPVFQRVIPADCRPVPIRSFPMPSCQRIGLEPRQSQFHVGIPVLAIGLACPLSFLTPRCWSWLLESMV